MSRHGAVRLEREVPYHMTVKMRGQWQREDLILQQEYWPRATKDECNIGLD